MIARIEKLMKNEVAGSPMGGLRWTRKSTKKIAGELCRIGIEVCANTVAKLLKQMGRIGDEAQPPGSQRAVSLHQWASGKVCGRR